MRSGPPCRSNLSFAGLLLTTLILIATLSSRAHAVTNGDFEQIPNHSWMTDRANAPRAVQGDRPTISVAPNGNHYAHIGDLDGIPAHGESPSRIFQWTDCADTLSIDPDCVVSFRFRALLLQGEVAWVRMSSARGQTVKTIPHSNNQWAAVRLQISRADPCIEGGAFLEFGLLNRQGNAVGGRLNIDDVRHRCDRQENDPPDNEDWDFLPDIPDPDDVDPVLREAPPTMRGTGSAGLAVLLVGGIILLLLKLRR